VPRVGTDGSFPDRRHDPSWYGSAMTTKLCSCCSGKEHAQCCGPLLEGKRKAETAEELLRSRYTAFTLGDVAYIRRTRHPRSSTAFDEEAVRSWAEGSEWHGLSISKVDRGGAHDDQGVIDFVATYTEKDGGKRHEHEEKASFVRHDGAWMFVDGDYVVPETFVRAAPKVGRNDPCPCGSGRKHKKCCGA
jgi:SEC-C motif domain protein